MPKAIVVGILVAIQSLEILGLNHQLTKKRKRPFIDFSSKRLWSPSMRFVVHFGIVVTLSLVASLDDAAAVEQSGGNWPMWRHDAARSGAAVDSVLPESLRLLWTKQLSSRRQVWDDPLNHDLMTYDRVFEPIVMDGRLFVGFNDRDKLSAFDTDTGKELWSAYADAPVRLPPVGWQDTVLFCSDDGCLYCVDAISGKVRWKFHGAPSRQKAIGNRRIISAWPARGGPVVRDGTVYFAASIWPFMGTFVYALDATNGKVQWVNDSTGAQYINQPHSAPSFAGVAPQGSLVATDELLLVPGGRSVPAAFNRSDGTLKYFQLNEGGKGTGGSFVAADEKHFYVHTRLKGTRAFQLDDGIKTAFMPSEPVLSDGMIYSAEEDKGKRVVRCYEADHKPVWEVDADGTKDLILVGDRLYAAGNEAITVIRMQGQDSARVEQSISVAASVERLIAADQKLFAVTLDCQIMAFGDGKPGASDANSSSVDSPFDVLASTHQSRKAIKELLSTGDAEGYALWFGPCDTPLAKTLYAKSEFVELAVVDRDAEAVNRMRRAIDQQARYGGVTIHHSDAESFLAPKYIANMVFVDGSVLETSESELIGKLYDSVRPYGGVMHLLTSGNRIALAKKVRMMKLEQAKVEIGNHSVVVRREGALPGSADWTHQYGNIANTIKSDDRRVKLPLGVLWFGGSSNMDVLPRHGHGPPEQVIGGRLFIQGENSLSARDVYTGRVLWKRDFKDLGTFDVYYDATYSNEPLDPKYNQVHIPGANGRGTNYVVTEDRVYLVEAGTCHVLDPSTGKSLTDIALPKLDETDDEPEWGYIGVYRDVLIGGFGFANYQSRHGVSLESDEELKSNKLGFGTKSYDRAGSTALVGFDRYSGEVLWNVPANHSFWHNGIVAGGDQIYCLDRNPAPIEAAMRRRGIASPDTYRIVALNYRTGKTNWQISNDIFGTWLGYSEEHDALLQAGAAGTDRLADETGQGMAVYSSLDGSVIWKNESLKYTGPCILHNDLIMTNTNSYSESAGAFYIKDGKQRMVPNPLTGDLQPWKMTRAYGCNNIIASENLLTFRSGAAGFYDLLTNSGTGNLGGFKSGCTSNLVVAGGVLNAPDYTRTCSCSYQNQTSLALVHMPEVELWSVNSAASVESTGNRIESVGLNFGAPGDRRDANGLLWLEYPASAGPSPPLSIQFNDDATFFQRHSSTVADDNFPWVFSSGVENVTDLRIGLNLHNVDDVSNGISIAHAADDAEEDAKGKVNLGSSDLELVEDSGGQIVGLRFNNLPLDRNATVRSATIQFTCDEPSSKVTSLMIAAEDSGNAQRFSTTSHDLSSRSLTRKEIAWSPEAWPIAGKSGTAHRTPNLAPLIQSVISRKDWKPGNSIAFLISGGGKRVASAWRQESSKSARLIVDADTFDALGGEAGKNDSYRVRLYFGAPKQRADSPRVFDVYVQDDLAFEDVTLNASNDHTVEELDHVEIEDQLHLRFVPKQGSAVLSGIEVVRMKDATK